MATLFVMFFAAFAIMMFVAISFAHIVRDKYLAGAISFHHAISAR